MAKKIVKVTKSAVRKKRPPIGPAGQLADVPTEDLIAELIARIEQSTPLAASQRMVRQLVRIQTNLKAVWRKGSSESSPKVIEQILKTKFSGQTFSLDDVSNAIKRERKLEGDALRAATYVAREVVRTSKITKYLKGGKFELRD